MKVEDVKSEWIDAFMHAFYRSGPGMIDTVSQSLAAVIPAIQAEALERAAVVADDKAAAYDRRWEAERKYSGRDASATADQRATALQLAAAIRALKEVVNPATSFPQPQRKDGHPPCYECHLQPGEKCDVCGAVKPKEPTP